MIRSCFLATAAISLGLPLGVFAQNRESFGTAKPKVDVVRSFGCVERRHGSPVTWWLSSAADPTVTQSSLLNTTEVEQSKMQALGKNAFQLVGVADFLDADALLQQGQRSQFTTPATANATGQLRDGHKVIVKGLLIEAADGQKRINLTAVLKLADACE
jgi:hypothetical protein